MNLRVLYTNLNKFEDDVFNSRSDPAFNYECRILSNLKFFS